MTKPITGQYEYLHRSGVGLDYFTSRIDRLTLLPNGRFTLIIQESSRVSNAAKSLINGQQIAANPPEVRREGTYSAQGNALTFLFDDGSQEQGQAAWNGEGMQFGPNFFNKVSDSTLLPSTHRLKKDMDDIAKGLKIAGTIGSMAAKAVKTVQDTIQTTQGTGGSTPPPIPNQNAAAPVQQPPTPQQPAPPRAPAQPTAPTYNPPPAQQTATPPPQRAQEAVFCDQCGARVRPGKRFCNSCGAQLP
jgi:hypothetical protein